MIDLPDSVADAIRLHAASAFPKESCGVLLVQKGKLQYCPCANLACAADVHFILSPDDLAKCEELGDVVAVVHSHPNTPPDPSIADRVGCEASGLPWLIVNWPTGVIRQFEPTGYEAPLIGRTFHHGVLDCYSLIRDHYQRELGIALPDFERESHWWLKGQNLYVECFPTAGFAEFDLDDLQPHDVLLMQVGSPVINHAAIYLGNNQILQHCANRLSSRDVFGGGWRRATRKKLRHQDLIQKLKP
jgi:proteasome lid subunit RPN8/RPN11